MAAAGSSVADGLIPLLLSPNEPNKGSQKRKKGEKSETREEVPSGIGGSRFLFYGRGALVEVRLRVPLRRRGLTAQLLAARGIGQTKEASWPRRRILAPRTANPTFLFFSILPLSGVSAGKECMCMFLAGSLYLRLLDIPILRAATVVALSSASVRASVRCHDDDPILYASSPILTWGAANSVSRSS